MRRIRGHIYFIDILNIGTCDAHPPTTLVSPCVFVENKTKALLRKLEKRTEKNWFIEKPSRLRPRFTLGANKKLFFFPLGHGPSGEVSYPIFARIFGGPLWKPFVFNKSGKPGFCTSGVHSCPAKPSPQGSPRLGISFCRPPLCKLETIKKFPTSPTKANVVFNKKWDSKTIEHSIKL